MTMIMRELTRLLDKNDIGYRKGYNNNYLIIEISNGSYIEVTNIFLIQIEHNLKFNTIRNNNIVDELIINEDELEFIVDKIKSMISNRWNLWNIEYNRIISDITEKSSNSEIMNTLKKYISDETVLSNIDEHLNLKYEDDNKNIIKHNLSRDNIISRYKSLCNFLRYYPITEYINMTSYTYILYMDTNAFMFVIDLNKVVDDFEHKIILWFKDNGEVHYTLRVITKDGRIISRVSGSIYSNEENFKGYRLEKIIEILND